MTTRARRYDAVVTRREQVSPHLVRLTLSVPGFVSTGIPDEWVGLVVPGSVPGALLHRAIVRRGRWADGADAVDAAEDEMVLDVVVHSEGLVTEWASGDCVGDTVVVTAPQGSFGAARRAPPGCSWSAT